MAETMANLNKVDCDDIPLNTEQIIGVYNGKALYRKSFEWKTGFTQGNHGYPASLTGITSVYRAYGSFGYQSSDATTLIFPANILSPASIAYIDSVSSTAVNIYLGQNWISANPIKVIRVTVEYLKS